MNALVDKKQIKKIILALKELFRNPKFVGMLTVAIITVSLPVTILALNNSTDNRQHASSCDYTVNFRCRHMGGDTSTPNNDWHGTYHSPPNGNCNSDEYCDTQVCISSYNGSPPCKKITNCTCNQGQVGKLGGSFSCNGGQVNRACGNTLYCDNNARQGGLWPCSSTSPQKKYRCNQRSCIEDDQGGTFTDSTCDNSCNSDGGTKCQNDGGHCVASSSQGVACNTHIISQDNYPYSCSGYNEACCANAVDCSNGTCSDSCPQNCNGSGTDDKHYWECDADPNFGACGGLVTQHNGPVWHYVTHNTATGWDCHDDTSVPCLSTISGHVFIDTNGNGVQDSGEPNVTGDLKTTVSLNSGETVTTDAKGNFTFAKGTPHQESLTGGDYTVAVATPPTGYAATTQPQTVTVNFDNRNPNNISLGIQQAAPTDSPAPTDTPTPTDSPIPPDPSKTTGNITLQFQGIGLNDNSHPLHPDRQIILYFYPASDTSFQHTPYVSPIGKVSYNNNTGYFANASFPLQGLSEGNYLVLVKSLDGSLVSQIGTGDGTGPISIVTTGGNNMIVDIQDQNDQYADTQVPLLKMGDIITTGASFNLVDTLDYSAFTDCYGQTPPALSDACFKHTGLIDPKTQVFLPDLNDDGKIDGTDYTILEGNYGHYGVGANTMNRGNDPTKN